MLNMSVRIRWSSGGGVDVGGALEWCYSKVYGSGGSSKKIIKPDCVCVCVCLESYTPDRAHTHSSQTHTHTLITHTNRGGGRVASDHVTTSYLLKNMEPGLSVLSAASVAAVDRKVFHVLDLGSGRYLIYCDLLVNIFISV